jgi:hypothetical protein
MVLELARPADWNALSSVWRGVQADLELPAPAIAVSGVDAYQLWFSLAAPVAVVDAQAFLEFLRLRYLGTVTPARIRMLPVADPSFTGEIHHASLVPALQQATGRWSAFVAPDLAAIFCDEPWLDLPPSADAQASVLSRLECIKPAVFQTILDQTKAATTTATSPKKVVADAAALGKNLDPRQFLQDVLNDEGIALHLRIEAAKALCARPGRAATAPEHRVSGRPGRPS